MRERESILKQNKPSDRPAAEGRTLRALVPPMRDCTRATGGEKQIGPAASAQHIRLCLQLQPVPEAAEDIKLLVAKQLYEPTLPCILVPAWAACAVPESCTLLWRRKLLGEREYFKANLRPEEKKPVGRDERGKIWRSIGSPKPTSMPILIFLQRI
ncbi:hypothetical protein EK904_008322 [Melospiza melodia maxima]|nr:hypothetical protein EK904_008322 [Melospiza melodia maxima]